MTDARANLDWELAFEIRGAITALRVAIAHIVRRPKALSQIESCLLLSNTLQRLKRAEKRFLEATHHD